MALFTLLGKTVRGSSDLAAGAIGVIHGTADAVLDNSGLSAFIPPAIHEVSDGILGLAQRGVKDVGHTGGAILESFGKKPLHSHDKRIGGNLKQKKEKKQTKTKTKTKTKTDGKKKIKTDGKKRKNKD